MGNRKLKYVLGDNGCFNCIEGSGHKRGYRSVVIDKRRVYAHRYVYEQRHGTIPDGAVIRHLCDNPKCINSLHLAAGTQRDNVYDMIAHGRKVILKGENSGRAVLTAENVKEILMSTDSTIALGKKFGVNAATVQRIKSGELWKSISGGMRAETLKVSKRLTDDDIRTIRESSETTKFLAEKYRVSQRYIYKIKSGERR